MTRRLRSDEGTSLIELTSVVAILGVIIAAIFAVLASSQSRLEQEISRSESIDQAALAAQSLDREIRSGNVLFNPTTENYALGDVAPNMSLRIFTHANAPSRGGPRCVQWRITDDQELQRREWAPNWDHVSDYESGWRTVATGIRNREDGSHAFSLPQANIVNIVLRANTDPTGRNGKTVENKLSVAGRNTMYSSTSEVCGPTVPQPLTGSQGQVPPY